MTYSEYTERLMTEVKVDGFLSGLCSQYSRSVLNNHALASAKIRRGTEAERQPQMVVIVGVDK